MDEIVTCPVCHTAVRPTDYFCFNCGANLKPKPVVLSAEILVKLVIGSLILPPLGIIWGVRYVKEKDPAVKAAGIAAIVVTSLVLVVLVRYTIDMVNSINDQVNGQLMNMQGL